MGIILLVYGARMVKGKFILYGENCGIYVENSETQKAIGIFAENFDI